MEICNRNQRHEWKFEGELSPRGWQVRGSPIIQDILRQEDKKESGSKELDLTKGDLAKHEDIMEEAKGSWIYDSYSSKLGWEGNGTEWTGV